MKAFRVKYTTPGYRVFSELVLVKDKTAIPAHLAAHSDKGFILEHPVCEVLAANEIPIEDIPLRDLTIGQLYELIDHRTEHNARQTPVEEKEVV